MPTIRTVEGYEVQVDEKFYPEAKQYDWVVRENRNGSKKYVARWCNEKRAWLRMHREVWLFHRKRIPEGINIDHQDTNSFNNQIKNLREATYSQNNANRRVYSTSETGLKGVGRRGDGKYTARICVDGKRKSLGVFETPEQAAAAYDTAAVTYFGEFAHTNGVQK